MSSQPAQDSWPDLVGHDADEAVRIIKEQNPSLNVMKLGENQPATMDLRMDRVRVVHDSENKVVVPPRIG